MNPRLIIAALLIAVAGCGPLAPTRVRALPSPAIETPPANLPASLHQRNWLGPLRQGSCVHASFVNHLRWLNQHELGERWRKTYSDGEWDDRFRRRLDAAGIDYAFTVKSDPRFLDWCSQTRRGAILWWKPSHCCTFQGWITNPPGKPPGQYAVILDNNSPGKLELTPREQFVRLWNGYGGFALACVDPPATSLPHQSYEVLK